MENFWDKRYAGADYLFGTQPAAGLIALEPHLVAGGKTLVVADGEGRNSVYLASRGYDVRATDYSQVAQKRPRHWRKRQALMWILSYPIFTMRGGVIRRMTMSSQSLSNLSRPNGWVKFSPHLHAPQRAGGTLLIHGYTPEQVALGTGGPGNPDHMYTPDMLAMPFPTCRSQ